MTSEGSPPPTVLGLRPVGNRRFDPDVTGLDHVSFAVASRAALEHALETLETAGIPHSQIVELTDEGIAVLSFRDPDDINLELTASLQDR